MPFDLFEPTNILAILAGICVFALAYPDDGDEWNPPFRDEEEE